MDLSKFFFDIDDDKLEFTARGLPEGLSLDPISGVLSGYYYLLHICSDQIRFVAVFSDLAFELLAPCSSCQLFPDCQKRTSACTTLELLPKIHTTVQV